MTIEETLTSLGVRLECTLLRDDFDGRDGQSHWQVTLVCNGQAFSTEYSMGCAHRHYVTPGGRRGKKAFSVPRGRITIAELERAKRSRPNNPTLVDVMYAIVSDAQCVANGETFEDFAAEFGYDEDSRKAERAYNGCRDEYFALRRLGLDLNQLSLLYQDY